MALVRSLGEILSSLSVFIRSYNKSIDTGSGGLLRDIILFPMSIAGRLLSDQATDVATRQYLSKSTGVQIDDEATNYTLERSDGSVASVTVTFWTITKPISDILIPAGQIVSTLGSSFDDPVIFNIVSNMTISSTSIDNYYSYDRARYEISASAIGAEKGSVGNVGADTITVITGSIAGITGVTNLNASVGGADKEDDDDLKDRVRLKRTGIGKNVPNGIRGYIKDSGFLDANAVRVEDSTSERCDGVDLFVIDPYVSSTSDTFIYYSSRDRYYLSKRPVKDVTSVVSSAVGTIGAAYYDAYIDNSSPLRRSKYGQDYIEIRTASAIPDGTSFTVTYNYNEYIYNLQGTLENDNNNVFTSNYMAKRAFPLSLYINATFTLNTNADIASTRTRCRNALSQFMSTYRLGDNIQKSDLTIVLQEGYGDFVVSAVDAVVINSFYLTDEVGINYLPINETISVGPNQYAVYGRAVLV